MTNHTYSPSQFSELLFLSKSRVRTLSREGVLRASITTPGGQRRYTEADLAHARKALKEQTQLSVSAHPDVADENAEQNLLALLMEAGGAGVQQRNVRLALAQGAADIGMERLALLVAFAWRWDIDRARAFIRDEHGASLHVVKIRQARISTFASPVGGSGRSSTALNYAVHLSQTPGIDGQPRRVLLIDGDIGGGTQAMRFVGHAPAHVVGHAPAHGDHSGRRDPVSGRYEVDDIPSLLSLTNYIDSRSDEGHPDEPAHFEDAADGLLALRDFVLGRDDVPNLHVLAAPDEPDFVVGNVDKYRELLSRLSSYYDEIVIDSGQEMWAHYNQVWYESADTMFVLVPAELPAINRCKKFLRYITYGRKENSRSAQRAVMTSKERINLVSFSSHGSRINMPAALGKLFPGSLLDQQHCFGDFRGAMLRATNTQDFVTLHDDDYRAAMQHLIRAHDINVAKHQSTSDAA